MCRHEFPANPVNEQKYTCKSCNVSYLYDAKNGVWVWIPF